jgi:hypothetical protein
MFDPSRELQHRQVPRTHNTVYKPMRPRSNSTPKITGTYNRVHAEARRDNPESVDERRSIYVLK